MLSDILNSHPDILSISELFILQGRALLNFRRLTGNEMWSIVSKQTRAQRRQLDSHSDALLYPVGTPRGRYSGADIPPVSWVTLPHITDRPDALLDELEPLIRSQPRQFAADHYRAIFAWLCRKFDRKLWVERSGGTGMYVHRFRENVSRGEVHPSLPRRARYRHFHEEASRIPRSPALFLDHARVRAWTR